MDLVVLDDAQLAMLKLALVGTPIQGPQGDSAFAVAVEEGFEGTIDEWLESLKSREIEFATSETHILWRRESGPWIELIPLDLLKTSLQKTDTHVQWKLGESAWTNLIPLAEINGREVEFRLTSTHIQWNYTGLNNWTDLVSFEDMSPVWTVAGKQGNVVLTKDDLTDVTTFMKTLFGSNTEAAARTLLQVYSVDETDTAITAAINALINGASEALDTLNELAEALNNDPNFATTMSTSLANRLRIDIDSQGLSPIQKLNAKTNLGIENVDNTADINKPVSGPQQTALDLKTDKSIVITTAGLAVGGGDLSTNRTINVPEASQVNAQEGADATQVMTPRRVTDHFDARVNASLRTPIKDSATIAAFLTALSVYSKTEVDAAIAALVDSAPDAINTLNELAAALGDDPNFATTMTNALAGKLSSADGAVTLAKLADLAEGRIIGRASGAGTGVPTALTPAQVRALIGMDTSISTGYMGVLDGAGSGVALSNVGAIELTGASGVSYIDFKNALGDDFDGRILYSTSNNRFEVTTGAGGFLIGGSQVATLGDARTFTAKQTFTSPYLSLAIQAGAGHFGGLAFQNRSGVERFALVVENDGAGSPLVLYRYNEAGAYGSTPLVCHPDTGVFQFDARPTHNGDAFATLGANETFTGAKNFAASVALTGTPHLQMVRPASGADEERWDIIDYDGNLRFRAVNDAATTANDWLTVSRSGYTTVLPTFNVPVAFNSDVTLGNAVADDVTIIGQIVSTETDEFFAQNSARIHRLTDRLLVGSAIVNSGDLIDIGGGVYQPTTPDWLSDYQIGLGITGVNGSITSSQMAVLTNDSASSAVGFTAGARSSQFTAPGTAAIAGTFIALNNNTTYNTEAWGLYIEAHRTNDTVGATYGMEIDTLNKGAYHANSPYNQAGGLQTVALQIASGAEAPATGQFDASAGIAFRNNPMKFGKGIVFGNNAIRGTDGSTGIGEAITFAKGHELRWYNADDEQTSFIRGDVGLDPANGTGIIFDNAVGFRIVKSSDESNLAFIDPSAGVWVVPGSYTNTTANAANVHIDSAGALLRSTSSARYKTDIQDYTPQGFDQLRPRTYTSKNDGQQYAGLIAEEVHDAGMVEFVDYDVEGRPDAVRYPLMVAALIAEVHALKKRVEKLESK